MNTKSLNYTKTIILCGIFAALSAVSSKLMIPFPIMPITLQVFIVLLSGMILGAKKGAISQLIYAIIGLLGLPVFYKGGGPQYIFEPSFGYIIGFIAGAYITGAVLERLPKINFSGVLIASFSGLITIYIFGVSYMYLILNLYLGKQITVWAAVFTGAIIYLAGDILKCILAAMLGAKIIPILKNAGLISK